MELKRLIKNLDVLEIDGNTDIDIKEIKVDSNQVTKGCMFICLCGKDFDGHDFIKQVEQYGASVIITEKRIQTSLTQILVKDTRVAMCAIASEFYESVDKKMKIIAVLGTNGKTTVSQLIKKSMDKLGMECGVIGTIGCFYRDKYIEPTLTTPDPLDLFRILFDMYKSGVNTVVMEVSAHAVFWDKIKFIKFYAAVFTNFSQDHLDFFLNMENYKQAKLKFFKENECEYVITNSDDILGREINLLVPKAISYGIKNPADIFAIDVEEKITGSKFVINLFDYVCNMKLNLLGEFNVYNVLAAACTLVIAGIKPESAVEVLESIEGVDGRLERVYDGNFKIYIDYAHTPDGLKKVLFTLKHVKEGKLINVFGCGGNRDEKKRKLMGEVSASFADFTVITSDNPRFEEPMYIINEIEKGVLQSSKNYVAIEDRIDAIKYAINMARDGDVILIAGKGCEMYQEILGIKKPYNDKDIVTEYLRSKTL